MCIRDSYIITEAVTGGSRATPALWNRLLTSIGRGFFSIGLHLHAAGDSSVGLTAREVSHVDERVVEGREDVADAKGVLGLLSGAGNGGSVVSDLLFFSAFFALSTLGRLLLLSL